MNTIPPPTLFTQLEPYLSPRVRQVGQPHVTPEAALEIAVHLRLLRATLSTYLPRHLIERLATSQTPLPPHGYVQYATVMQADISGFTAMSEKLNQLGREGAEEITAIVNRYFSVMLEISLRYGGDLLKFGGDALLILFAGANGPHRAITAAQEMQAAMTQFAALQTSQGIFPLRMTIGLGTGHVFLADIGSADKRELVITGPTLQRMGQAEYEAESGQIMVDPATYQETLQQAQYQKRPTDFYQLCLVKHPAAAVPSQLPDIFGYLNTIPNLIGPTPSILADCTAQVQLIQRLQPYLPGDLFTKLTLNPQKIDALGSHRPVTVMFANILGLDELTQLLGKTYPNSLSDILTVYLETMRHVIMRYDGVVTMVDPYRIGHRIMAVFGLLRAHEDDPQRATHAALEMKLALEHVNQTVSDIIAVLPSSLRAQCQAALNVAQGGPLQQRIALNMGMVFASNVGSNLRRAYTVMGDEVNLTARLMQLSQIDEILVSEHTAQRLKNEFILHKKPLAHVKGKTQAIRTFAVVEPLEARPQITAPRDVPLIGRETELQWGRTAVDHALIGEGQALVISGVSGIGKTRLAEEIVAYGQSLGMEVLSGLCFSYGHAMLYHPWLDVWRAYFGIKATDNRQARIEAVERGMASLGFLEWAPIVGDALNLDIPNNSLTAQLDAKLRRQRLFDLTLDLLKGRAKRYPLIIVIEDIHWADPASVDLLNYVVRNISRSPILFILPHRPDLDITQTLNYPHVHSLALGDLPDSACLAIVRSILGAVKLPPELQALLLQKASGNPLFIEEVVRVLTSTGVLQRNPEGVWEVQGDPNDVDLPDTIHGIIISRIDRLHETDQQVLQIASVIGRVFMLNILNGVFDQETAADFLDERLRYLSQIGLTEVQSVVESLYRFRHITTHEVVYETQAFERRRHLHRRIGNFIELEYAESLNEYVDLMAYHFFEGRAWLKAIRYNLQSGQHAQRDYGHETARLAYQRVLEAAAQVEADTQAEELQAHEGLGDVLTLLGRYDEAIVHYQATQDMIEQTAPLALPQLRHLADLCRKRADVYERYSQFEKTFEWLMYGLQYLDEMIPTVEAARVYVRGAVAYDRQGKVDEAIEWGEQGLAIAERIKTEGGRRVAAHASYVLGGLYGLRGDYERGLSLCERSVTLYHELDDKMGVSSAYNNLSILYQERGDLGASLEFGKQSLKNKEKVGDLSSQGIIFNNLALVYIDQGKWELASSSLEKGLELFQKLGYGWAQAAIYSNLAQVALGQQKFDETQRYLLQGEKLLKENGSQAFQTEFARHWALYFLGTEQYDVALAKIEASLTLAQNQSLSLEEGISRRVKGQVLLVAGQFEKARKELEQALLILNNLQSEYQIAKTKSLLAQVLLSQDPATAKQYLAEAKATFTRLEAQIDLAQVKDLQGVFGISGD